MSKYVATISVHDGELDEIMKKLNEAQNTIYQCYSRLEELDVMRIESRKPDINSTTAVCGANDEAIVFSSENDKSEECSMKLAGRESGKNSIFQAVLGSMKYLTDIVSEKHKARIVFDYDPDNVNWYMTVFISKDAPIPENIR